MSDEEHKWPGTFNVIPPGAARGAGGTGLFMGTTECSCGLPFMAVGATESRVGGNLLKQFRAHKRQLNKPPKGWERVPLKEEEE